MAKPTDWLGSFIEEEIRLAISWKQDRQRLSHVKQDPNTRFSDDMSNFRSVASATLLPGDPKLQISKVLSTQDPVTVLVTDGFTQVRAILSASVVRTLEAEIDEEITLESKNDVFTVREVTVTTTSFGLAERFIQLEIDDIDYQYLLRKAVGQPVPVAQKEPIVGLIKIISDLRAQEYRVESDHQRPSPGSPSLGSGLDASRRSDHNLDDTPKSQNSQNFQRLPPQYSSPIAAIGSQSTQHPIATQVPVRRKRKAAALAEDGFETVDGVNMDLPTGLRVDSTKYKSPSSTEKQPNNGSKATLIELLGKHKSGQLQQAAQKSRNASEPAIEPAHEVERPIEPSPPAPGGRGIATESQIIAQREIERNASNSPRAKTKVPPIDYSRRKIPRDQQKLLDQASSWLPSLPGQQFPHPNVPIELLRRWNAQAASVLNRSISSDTSAQPPRNDEFAEISRSASVSSDEESSEDEEFSASQWPASPSQPKAALPPDSTMTSSTKASPVQVRPTFPDFSPTAQHRRVQQPQSTHSGSPHSIASGSHRALHAHSRPPSRSSRYLDNGGSRPSTAQSRNRSDRVNDSPARSSALQLKGSQLPSYGPNSPNELHRSPWRRESAEQFSSQQSKSRMQTTPGRVLVKGTQVPMNDDEDGMEMDVPRSLDEDPTLAHRKRRSEFFKNAQRRDWIQQTYVPRPNTTHHFSTIYRAYKEAYPKDLVKLSEFAAAIEEAYPDLSRSSDAGLALRFPKQDENVLSTSGLRTSIADVGGVRETPAKAPGKPTSKSEMGSPQASELIQPKSNSGQVPLPPPAKVSHIAVNGVKSPVAPVNGRQVSTSQRKEHSTVRGTKRPDEQSTTDSPRFNEFVHAWKTVQPRGAFAREEESGRPARKQLDVLAWDL